MKYTQWALVPRPGGRRFDTPLFETGTTGEVALKGRRRGGPEWSDSGVRTPGFRRRDGDGERMRGQPYGD